MSEYEQLLSLLHVRRLPPTDLWHPKQTEDIDIRIDKDGRWYHEGGEIWRIEICRVFGTLLRYEESAYFLVTPHVRLRIAVEDAPFVAIDVEWEGEGTQCNLAFRTNLDDVVVVDREHPIRVETASNGPRPYVVVRNGLTALIARSVYYRLASLANPTEQENGLEVWSSGTRFRLL